MKSVDLKQMNGDEGGFVCEVVGGGAKNVKRYKMMMLRKDSAQGNYTDMPSLESGCMWLYDGCRTTRHVARNGTV